jgi:phage repressor protein C with HTH and peptisase S24 domain
MSFAVPPSQSGQFSVLQLALPSGGVRNIGVFLLDPSTDRLYLKLRRDWSAIAGAEYLEFLNALEADLEAKAAGMGGGALLRSLEESLSNVLRITEREKVESIADFRAATARLFEDHVQRTEIIPFVTHVPLYSLRAAAGKFGEDMEVEPEGWAEAPARMKLDRNMFAARVVGRSMEPVIRDGSTCLFRAGVVGSRQGKRLLIEQMGATDTSARYTVKVYTSKKLPAEDEQWRHISIQLKPLNPEFEPMEFGPEDEHRRFRVIAEFVQVLEAPPI